MIVNPDTLQPDPPSRRETFAAHTGLSAVDRARTEARREDHRINDGHRRTYDGQLEVTKEDAP